MSIRIGLFDKFLYLLRSGLENRNNINSIILEGIDPEIKVLLGHSKYRKEVAAEYDWSLSTFFRKLKEADIKIPPGKICPADLVRIYSTFGLPKVKSGYDKS